MLGVVIGSRVAWTVTKDCPFSFYHNGDWYVWDKDYWAAVNYYQSFTIKQNIKKEYKK